MGFRELDEKKIIENLEEYYLHENMLFVDKPDTNFNRGQILVPKTL